MRRAMIDPQVCQNCAACTVIDRCDMKAPFREEAGTKPWIDFYRCSGCMRCKEYCFSKAIVEITRPCDGKRRMGW